MLIIITGRNEVLAKVIFSQASVIHSVHGGGVWSRGGAPNFQGGFLQICGGVPPNFRGGFLQIFKGGGVPPNFFGGFLQILGGFFQNFWGGSPNFLGGFLQIFGGSSEFCGGFSKFSGGCLHQNTVNVRPVRILLECILVMFDVHPCLCFTLQDSVSSALKMHACDQQSCITGNYNTSFSQIHNIDINANFVFSYIFNFFFICTI